MKKKPDPPKTFPLWQSTFSDLMNLLLCFFVLLFSMSSINEDKYQMVVNSLQTAFTSIMATGGNTILAGSMVSSGISQLPDFSNYLGDSLSEGDANGESDTGTVEMTDDSSKESTPDADSSSDTDETVKEGNENGNRGTDTTSDANDTENGGSDTTSDANDTGNSGSDNTKAENDTTIGQSEESLENAEEALDKAAYEESEKMAEDIMAEAKQYGIQDMLQVDYNGDFVKITLSGALLFDSGSSELRSEAEPLIIKLATILQNYPSNLIDVEGHTDNVPMSSSKFESNDVLSMYRALDVANLIRENSVIDPGHIISTGRGDYDPVADNSTPEGRARNRRVEIKVYNSYNSDSISTD